MNIHTDRLYPLIDRCANAQATLAADAARHLSEGFARRLLMIRENLESVDRIATPDRTTPLSGRESVEINVHVNSFYVHLRGTLDNLAWALQYEWHVLGPADENDIRTRRQCGLADTRFRQALNPTHGSLVTALAAHDGWLADLSNFRDPVAHRIPLYAVPGVIEKGSPDESLVREIHREIEGMMAVGGLFDEIVAKFAEAGEPSDPSWPVRDPVEWTPIT